MLYIFTAYFNVYNSSALSPVLRAYLKDGDLHFGKCVGYICDHPDAVVNVKLDERFVDAVVIGKAITNPMAITRYFITGVPEELR